MNDRSNDAPGPPIWLKSISLPLSIHSAEAPLYRVHRSAFDPVFFGPGPGNLPEQRYDSASGGFGALYVAPGPEACLIETLLRTPGQRMIAEQQLRSRSISALQASRDLRLVNMVGSNLSALGTTGALHTGAYAISQRWSDALYGHSDQPDGILYTSRHNPSELCAALFEKNDFTLEVLGTSPLMEERAFVARVLDAHGKSVIASSS